MGLVVILIDLFWFKVVVCLILVLVFSFNAFMFIFARSLMTG